jgi:hypothetical protein
MMTSAMNSMAGHAEACTSYVTCVMSSIVPLQYLLYAYDLGFDAKYGKGVDDFLRWF